MPFLKYHLYIIYKKKNSYYVLFICFITVFALMYFANAYETDLEIKLNMKNYVLNYQTESYEILRLFVVVIAIFLTKEMAIRDDQLVKSITDKKQYAIYLQLTLFLIFLVSSMIFYFLFQLVGFIVYDIWIVNVNFLVSLLINAWFIANVVLLLISKSNQMVVTLSILVTYFILMRVQLLNHVFVRVIAFIIPLLTIKTSQNEMIHGILMSLLVVVLVYRKQIKEFS